MQKEQKKCEKKDLKMLFGVAVDEAKFTHRDDNIAKFLGYNEA